MCGICGIVTMKMQDNYKAKVKSGLRKLYHRGPDDINVFCDNNVVLGYVRLAIRGNLNEQYNQPIKYHNIVAFGNGEVYLENNKTVDSSKNDLLPLVKGIVDYEGEIFKNFDADFSIGCYDKANKKFYLARDFFGVKPLFFYFNDNETIFFASEIKALLDMIDTKIIINQKTILDYLMFGYPLEDNTFYKDIYTISPGSILIFDLNNKKLEYKKYFKKYFYPKYTNKENNKSIFEEIKLSVNSRLISEQKLGFHLSGGQDSSLIVYLSHEKLYKQHCFTAYINKKDNDLKYSKRICKNLNCKQHIIQIKNNNYEELIKVLDTPIMSSGDFVPLKLAQIASKNKIKVLLEGQGADELFLGYSRFKEIKEKMNLHELITVLNNVDINLLIKIFKLDITPYELTKLYFKYFIEGDTNIAKAQYFYVRNFLQELLRVEDHVHMYYSIENRVPFLSLNIRNWLNNNEIIINQKSNKNAEYNVHTKMNTVLVERTGKENLNGSLNKELLRNRNKFKKILNNEEIFTNFDYPLINSLLVKEKIVKLNKKEAFLLWHIYNLCIWYSKNKFKTKICLKDIIEEMLI